MYNIPHPVAGNCAQAQIEVVLNNIYFIGDSKYYKDAHDITGAPLYKQFTYARNAIQYNVQQLYIEKIVPPEKLKELRYRDSIPLDISVTGEEMQKYRDSLTEGYNVTPNFFIRNGVPEGTPDGHIDYSVSLRRSTCDT